MPKLLRLTAALIMLILCATAAAAAEDILDITLTRGERWTIPAERTGKCVISDETVVTLEDGQLIGLRPGRAEVRITGEQDTLLRILVLYTEAVQSAEEDTQPQESVPAHPASDYRYYTVSDGDEADDSTAGDQDIVHEDEPIIEADTSESSEIMDQPSADATAEDIEPETETNEATELEQPDEAQTSADTAYTETDITIQSYDRAAVPDAINTVIDFTIDEWRTAANKTFSRAGSKNKYSFW